MERKPRDAAPDPWRHWERPKIIMENTEPKRNLSASVSWVDREIKRFKETGRLIPELQERLYRNLSREWVAGKTVVDIGCSLGVGSNIMSHEARFVWGVDVNQEAVSYATQAFKRPNLDFAILDIENPPSRPLSKFDIVVASEVIEHLGDVQAGLNTMKGFFGNNTVGFITAPNQANPKVVENEAKHGFHLQKWTAGEFYGLMTENFNVVTMFSGEKIEDWTQEETIDGNSQDYLIVARVEGLK